MAPKIKSFLSHPIDKSFPFDSPLFPFFCFGTILLANTILSYFHFSITTNLWVILLGLLLPLFLASNLPPVEKSENFLPLISPWIWISLSILFIFLRFYQLSGLSTWPIVDEGVFGYFATLLKEKWSWQLTHGYAQEPVLYTWGQFLFFKLFGNSLFSLWFYPACCSLLALPLAFFAARKTQGPSMGFLVLSLMGLGFWPLYLGRISVQSALMVPWEWMVFLVLIKTLSLSKNSRMPFLFLLSFLTALGFYIYLAWPLVAFMVLVGLLFQTGAERKTRFVNISTFLLAQIVFLCPLAIDYLKDNHNYLGHLWSPAVQENLAGRLPLPWNYLKALFWGTETETFSHGPLWGGLFNPVMTTFFLWGMLDLIRFPRKPLDLWILLSLFVSFLPAFLTNNFEMMRLTALLPILFMVCAIGARSLLGLLPQGKRLMALGLILTLSCLLDSRHLFQVYPSVWTQNPKYYDAHKTPEFFRAYNLLKPMAEEKGPGLLFLNFLPDPYDQTLYVATYSFNAAENPALNPGSAQWAALITNIHEQPSLKHLFPEGQWIWLSEGLNRSDGGLLLEMILITPKTQGTLEKWREADLSLSELTRQVMETGVDSNQNEMLEGLARAYPFFRGDPLLESRFRRIEALHHLAGGDNLSAMMDYRSAIDKGVPMAHLYDELAKVEWKSGDWKKSENDFKAALACRPNLTDAAQNLRALETIKKEP